MDQHSQDNVQQAFFLACERARQRSINHECTIHVNAQVVCRGGLVYIKDFICEDWYVDGSTVRTYYLGEEQ